MRRNRAIDQTTESSVMPAANATVQRKMTVGSTNDPLEHEADDMADKVMRMPETPLVQRKCASCEYDDDHVHLKSLSPFIQAKGEAGGTVSNSVSNKIQSTRGGGSPIGGQTKSFMESRFGQDFSGVRVHADGDAAQMSKELNAQAFTTGSDIYFNSGKYVPESADGKRLLAHELTHTMQQGEHSVIRRTETTHYGDFKDESYTKLVDGAGNNIGVEMDMKFQPNDNVDAKQIAMVQSARTVENGVAIAINSNATIQSRMIKSPDAMANSSPVLGTDEGIHIDQLSRDRNPLYATGAVKNTDTKLSQGKTPEPVKKLPVALPGPEGELYQGWGTHGYHYKEGRHTKKKDAELHDNPYDPPVRNNSEQLFETTALATKGNQMGTYYGSVEWGWRTDAHGNFTQIPFSKKSNGEPGSSLLKAASIWNKGKSSTLKPNIALPVDSIFFVRSLWGLTLNDGLTGRGPLRNDWLIVGTRVRILEYHTIGPFLSDDDLAGKVRVEVVGSGDKDLIGAQGWVDFSDLTNERP